MSEELKQKAREELSKAAAQFVIDRAKMRGLTIDQFLQGNAVGLMAEFAAQVCEQREKEGIATIRAAGFEINPPETLHGAICQILQVWMSWKDAAEAAELALQAAKKELAENEA